MPVNLLTGFRLRSGTPARSRQLNLPLLPNLDLDLPSPLVRCCTQAAPANCFSGVSLFGISEIKECIHRGLCTVCEYSVIGFAAGLLMGFGACAWLKLGPCMSGDTGNQECAFDRQCHRKIEAFICLPPENCTGLFQFYHRTSRCSFVEKV
jgi:hypothetical protein